MAEVMTEREWVAPFTIDVRRKLSVQGRGRGDPTFSDSMRAGDYRNAFRDMADSLAARGIHRIHGSLRRAGDAFPDSTYGFGWQVDDQDEIAQRMAKSGLKTPAKRPADRPYAETRGTDPYGNNFDL